MSARDPVFETYLQSILRMDVLGGPVEVRPEAQNTDTGSWPFADTVYIVGAWNPNDELVSDEQNDLFHEHLLRDVRRLEIPSMAAVALAQDQSWAEPCVAIVGIEREVALELGNRFVSACHHRGQQERPPGLELYR